VRANQKRGRLMEFRFSLKIDDVRERIANKLRATTNFRRFGFFNIKNVVTNIPLGAAFTYFVISENIVHAIIGGMIFWLFFPVLGAYALKQTVNRISRDLLKSAPNIDEFQIEIHVDESRIQFKNLGASLEFDTSFRVIFNEAKEYYELHIYRKDSVSPCELLSIKKSAVSNADLIDLKLILSKSFSGRKT